MHRKFLPYLCCPETQKPLLLEVIEETSSGFIKAGILSTEDGLHQYSIREGIPRFVKGEEYADSFGREWEMFPQVQFQHQNSDKAMRDHTEKMFYGITEWDKNELKNHAVVEFGSGAGRFIDIVHSAQGDEGLVIGLELSGAADVARKNFGENCNVLIVQGDALQPPFFTDILDFVYSIGVLHHTPLPAKGLKEMMRVAKVGGKVSVCVYNAQCPYYAAPSIFGIRKFINLLKKKIGETKAYKIALWYSKFAGYFLYYIDWIVSKIPVVGANAVKFLRQYMYALSTLPDTQWRILDTFDAITPTYASTHSPEEIEFWLKEFGCTEYHNTRFAPASYTAIK